MRRRRFEREVERRVENALRIHAELHGRQLLEPLPLLGSFTVAREGAEEDVAAIGEKVQ